MQESPIIARLTRMRRTVRCRLVLYGLFAVLAGGVAAFLTVVAVDWLVWLPPVLRMVVSVLFFAGFVIAVMHWIVAPLRTRLGMGELAGKIERHFRSLQDRLASSVNFLERGDAGSSSLARRVVDTTEETIESLWLESALAIAPVAWRGALFCASVIFLALSIRLSPDWVRTGFYRYVYPSGDIEWPRSVSILPMTAGQTVAMGESAAVRMQVRRGWRDSLRAVVHLRETDGMVNTLTLQDEGDGVFSTTIDAVTSDLAYWFEAGDDSTIRNPATIRVVRRAEVVDAFAVIEPPPYAAKRPSRTEDLRDGPVSAPQGGFVGVTLRTSKSIPTDATRSALGLQLESGEMIPLEVDAADAQKVTARFEVTRDVEFRPVLRDEYGFENRGAPLYSVRAVPDASPTVAVLQPSSVAEITPDGSIRVVVRAEDDFGVERIDLVCELPSIAEPRTISLAEQMRVGDEGPVVQAFANYVWNVTALGLSPGDVVIYAALAVDNYRGPGSTGQESRTTPLRLKIVSASEYEIRVREDLASVEERLRRLTIDQADLHDHTRALQLPDEAVRPLTDAEREVVSSLSVSQVKMSRHLRAAAARLDDIVRRIEDNLSNEREERSRLAALAESVRTIAVGPAAAASASLSRAAEPNDAVAEQANISDAAKSQETAMHRLHEVLRAMGQWGTFQGLISRTRDLLDRQSEIRSQTAELGKSMLGKPVESLDDEEHNALRRNQRLQEQLTDDVTQHLVRLEQQKDASREKDQSGTDAIDTALRGARANDMARHLREAAEAIGANRTAAATNEQRAAAEALRKMLSALQDRETRELARLRKRIDLAARQVAALIDEQRGVRAASEEVGLLSADQPRSDDLGHPFDSLAVQQRTLGRNAKMLGEELMDNEPTADAGRRVRQSSVPMARAESDLAAKQAAAAVVSQDEALKLLVDAHDALLAAEQQTAEALFRRTLGEIRDDLQAMLAGQQAVNAGIAELQGAVAKLGRVGRSEAREAAKLAREQLEVRGMVATTLPDLEQVAVYRWALERVGRWMDESRSALDERRVDDDLRATTERIEHELEKLITAIIATESMPLDTEFAEADSGGGGGAGDAASSAAPVPTVAELLVLKAMQNDINERTATLYTRFDARNPMEKDLRLLTMIGEDQSEVRRLAELVTNRAKGH